MERPMPVTLQSAQNDFAASVEEFYGPSQRRYISDDLNQLRAIAREIEGHHTRMAALVAGLTLANVVDVGDGLRREAAYDVADGAAAEIDFLNFVPEAISVVRALTSEYVADQVALAA
jgi:hypothetical protein